jgi:hypothetical protein
MSVAVPAPNAAGQDALVYSPVAVRPEPPKVPELDSSGEHRDPRDQERQAPKDHVSERLQSIARLAQKREAKEASSVPQSSPQQQSLASNAAQQQTADNVRARTAKPDQAEAPTSKPKSADLRALSPHVTVPTPEPKAKAPTPQAQQVQAPLHAGLPKPSTPNTQQSQKAKPSSSDAESAYAQAVAEANARRARQPGPAEVAGLPDAVARYDSNGDGRIDQTEMKQVYRAKDERSSYAGLAQPRHPVEESKPFFAEDTPSSEAQKLYAGEDIPLPGEERGSFAPPLPGTADAEPYYTLPGEDVSPQELTPEERRALAREQDIKRGQFADEAPPLYIPPEDKAAAEDVLAATESTVADAELLQPRKLYDRAEDIDKRDALETYRQVSEGGTGRSSIIA